MAEDVQAAVVADRAVAADAADVATVAAEDMVAGVADPAVVVAVVTSFLHGDTEITKGLRIVAALLYVVAELSALSVLPPPTGTTSITTVWKRGGGWK